MLARLILSAVAVGITAYFMDSVTIEPWWVTVIVAVVLGLINAVVRPVVKLLSLPLTLLTLGLFALVVNGLMVMLCAYFVDGFNNIIERQMVLDGEDATEPNEAKRDFYMNNNPPDDSHHYEFVCYDRELTNITGPTVIRAIYRIVNN